MKAISLWQPWASLVALNVKTIETRSWSTKYRGPLAIHAAKAQRPEEAAIVALSEFHDSLWPHFGFTVRPMPTAVRRKLPRGAVVATCTLVDIVPIIDPDQCEWHHEHPRGVGSVSHAAIDGQVIVHRQDAPMHTTVLVEKAFGDYSPGRWAWLLSDIKTLDEPFRTRGHQGLWNLAQTEATE